MKAGIFFINILINEAALAQSPSWIWAKSEGDTKSENGNSVAADGAGNIYVTGYFVSPNLTIGSYNFINAGTNTSDIFIAKYDATGAVEWAISAGGSSDDIGKNIAIDKDGNAIITGTFNSGAISFGSYALGNGNSTGSTSDIFLIKFDKSGNILWAKREGGSDHDVSTGVCTDGAGNIVLTGNFGSQSITFGSTVLNNAGTSCYFNCADLFVTKYDPDGNVLWAIGAGSPGLEGGQGITCDKQQNILVTGNYGCYPFILGMDTLNCAGSSDIFTAKFDPAGNVLWTERLGATRDEHASGIACDDLGNLYITGNFKSQSVSFGTATILNSDNTGNSFDIFFAKYSPAGIPMWAKRAGATGGPGYDRSACLKKDPLNGILAAGYFNGTSISFDSLAVTNNSGGQDIFVVNYDTAGNYLWVRNALCRNNCGALGVASDLNSNVWVTGFFTDTAWFDSFTLNSVAPSAPDIFLGKLGMLTGISEDRSAGINLVYPNPSSGNLTIISSQKISFIEIYDGYGGKVYQSEINSEKAELALEKLHRGLYHIRIISGEAVETKKIIID